MGRTIFEKNMRSGVREQLFLRKTSERHPPNNHFYQKQASGTRRTSIFIKNKRVATAEQAFLSKTSERQPPNSVFYKQTHQTPWGLEQRTEQAHDAAPQALKKRTMGEIANGFDVYTGLLVVQINGFKVQGRGTVVEK